MPTSPSPFPASRRRFLTKTGLSLFALPGLWLLRSMLRRQDALPELRESFEVVPAPSTPGVRFFDQAIVVSTDRGVSVFSSRCPHLGCQIARQEGDELVCPCHGSRFGLDGAVHHGPAIRGLRPLRFEQNPAAASLRIHLDEA